MTVTHTRVGFCLDWLFGKFGPPFFDGIQLAFDEALEEGVIDRPIEIVLRETEGLPRGDAFTVLTNWRELADEGVVAILGPFISDNALALRDEIETRGRIPTLSWCGSDRWYGEWCFSISNGSLPEEPYLMANFLAHQRARRLAVVIDDSAVGVEYRDFFRKACGAEGLVIVQEETISSVTSDLEAPLRSVRASEPDALVYLGFGIPAVEMNKVLREIDWDPLRVMPTSFLTAPFLPEGLGALKGWIGVDQFDEENVVAQDFLDRFQQRFGYRPENYLSVLAYDSGRLLAHGIGNARPVSPAGVKAGLEQIKMLPAATGGAGTLLSFGPYVRRAWLGADYLVMREATGDGGDILGTLPSIMRHKFRPLHRDESPGPAPS